MKLFSPSPAVSVVYLSDGTARVPDADGAITTTDSQNVTALLNAGWSLTKGVLPMRMYAPATMSYPGYNVPRFTLADGTVVTLDSEGSTTVTSRAAFDALVSAGWTTTPTPTAQLDFSKARNSTLAVLI